MRGKIPFFAVGSVLVLSVAGGGLAGTGRWETLLKTPWAQDFLKAYFSDPSRGWVLGQWGTLLRTVDGGSSWTQVLWRDSLGCEAMAGAPAWECYGPEVHGLAVIEDSLVWVVGVEHLSQGGDAKGFVLHSPDGGTTWRWQLSVPFRALRDVSFVNSVRGWAVGDSGTIVSTSDGGGVWVRQASGVSATLCAVCFADSLWGWVVGTDGTALHTTDGGVAWHPVTVPQATYVDVFFVDRLHGWLLESSRSVLRTIDGGNSWQEVRVTDLDFPLTSLFFIDSREGWVALGRLPGGLHGRQAPSLFATTDGGETWVTHLLPFAPAGNDVVFVGKEAGFLAGAEGTILRTADGGQEWHPLMPVPARALRRVYFADHRHGWVTGDRLCALPTEGQPGSHAPMCLGCPCSRPIPSTDGH